MVLIFLGSCNTVQKETQVILKPVDNGMGIPGIVVLRSFDSEKELFEGLHLGPDEMVYLKEEDVSGSALLTRNRLLELLVKEAALSDYLNDRRDEIKVFEPLLQSNKDRLSLRVK